ncbi:MAG: multiheme c-type cytochrome [bacterium]
MSYPTRTILALAMFFISMIGCVWNLTSLEGQTLSPKNDPNVTLLKWRAHDYAGNAYVGSKACAQCHTTEAATQLSTPMAQALTLASDCQVLRKRPSLTFRNGSFSYEIARRGNGIIYTVTAGVNTISEPILYCFGEGKVGQTYVFKHNGLFYETRLSYYEGIQKLDFTTGHSRREPTSLEEALGRAMSWDEAGDCFGCHTTAAFNGSQLQPDHLIPGVACEGCHGPGEKHIAAAKARRFKDLEIFNPGMLAADGLTQEFCGTCHRSFNDAMLLPMQGGINNIRFQPYRIFNSPGHKDDPRISCVACHNPHDKLQRQAAFYDSKCLACHLSSPKEAKTRIRKAPGCPVSRNQCVTCHMPRIEVPEMHSKFTDHWIRIARPNEQLPN